VTRKKKGTKLALEAKTYMDKGGLVPDEITIKMVLEKNIRTGFVKMELSSMVSPRTSPRPRRSIKRWRNKRKPLIK